VPESNPEIEVTNVNGKAVVALSGAAVLAFALAQYGPTPFDAEFESASKLYGEEVALLKAIARRESRFRPSAIGAVNGNGTRDYGLMQINEKTAHGYGVNPSELVGNVPLSLKLASRALKENRSTLLRLGHGAGIVEVVSAYNQGAGNVIKRGIVNVGYVSEVLIHYTMYQVRKALP